MVITVQVSITPLHLWDTELVGTSPLSWEAAWIIQASKKLQYPDLCKIPRIKRFRKPTINTTVQNKLNKCICWNNVLSSEETLYTTSRCGVYNFLYHTRMFINTFTANHLNTQGLNNSYLKSPASTLVDLTFQSRALRSFSLNQLRKLSL